MPIQGTVFEIKTPTPFTDRGFPKLFFYYYADHYYINFQDWITNLCRIYKTCIWLSAVSLAFSSSRPSDGPATEQPELPGAPQDLPLERCFIPCFHDAGSIRKDRCCRRRILEAVLGYAEQKG